MDERDDKEILKRTLDRAHDLLCREPELRVTCPDPSMLRHLEACASSADFIEWACLQYHHRPALGFRTGATFDTVSYGELWVRTQSFAAGLFYRDLLRAGEGVGILGFASLDCVLVEWSCLLIGAMSASLQAHMPENDLVHCLNEAKLSCIACSVDILERVAPALMRCPSVRHLIIMDQKGEPEEQRRISRVQAEIFQIGPPIVIHSMSELENLGAKHGPIPKVKSEPGRDPILKILYTSGSTGVPKGAVIRESLWLARWRKCVQAPTHPDIPAVWFNFAPLNHLAGTNVLMRSVAQGSLLHFISKSDMSTLFEDIRLARPTKMFIIPRVSNLIYQHFQAEVLRLKMARPESSSVQLENHVMQGMRLTFLGDRLLELRTGSAPTSPEVLSFLRSCFEVPVYNTYGSTEADVLTINDRVIRPHVMDYKLSEVAELGYSPSDRPYPRGELRVKVQHAIAEYFQHDSAECPIFDEAGYLVTGDIFEQRAPDHIVWVDRKKNIIKLSQGEFVSLWRLESLFTGGRGLIDQIFLYASSLRSYLLAVVVPSERIQNESTSTEELKKALRDEIQRMAAEAGLQAYEIPRDFMIERERFSKTNGLLTESGKQHPGRLKHKYQRLLEDLYDQLEHKQIQHAMMDSEAMAALPVEVRVKKALTAILGIEDQFERSFREFGGDSLGAVRLSAMIEQVTQVSVPVSQILNPRWRLQDLITHVKDAQAGGVVSSAQIFSSIHGDSPHKLRAGDLTLARFLTPWELEEAHQQPRDQPSSPPRCILLTGANGFLGRFLLLELFHQLPEDGRVICLVRAADNQEAEERIRTAMVPADDFIQAEISELLTQKRLLPLAGDLSQPYFGWSQDDWQELSFQVDAILHNGALVNHALTYEQLFEPNVMGTVEAIRFALHGKSKSFIFISSIAVAGLSPRTEPVLESARARDLREEWPIEQGYAAGYAATKWAGEVLLEDLQKHFSVPVTIIRCGMILAHSHWPGQINVSDMFSRLLCGLAVTGLAPQSFYTGPCDSEAAYFDGIPVDFVSKAAVALACHTEPGYSLYHMVNDHGKGASLDVIVEWIRTAGYRMERMDDYRAWYLNFDQRLKDLNDVLRQATPLPILYQWKDPIVRDKILRLDASKMRRRLGELGLPSYVPELDEKYIHHCLACLQGQGVIPEPSALPSEANRR